MYCLHSNQTRSGISVAMLLLVLLQVALLAGRSISQEEIPDYFIQIEDGSRTLNERFATAQRRFQQNHSGTRFWIGYRFELRDDVELTHFYTNDHGSVTISRSRDGTYLFEDDDLETHVLHALGELGDERSREEFRKRQRDLSSYVRNNWGLFLLLDDRNLTVQKIKLFHYRRKRIFNDYPVFWLGDLDNNMSFRYIKDLIENDRYPGNVIKPALLALSLHDHPRVVPFLADVAGGDRYLEIRKSAAFWLSQIPEEASFRELVKLFDREENREMKKRLVFSIGQHKSESVADQLAGIAYDDRDLEIREKAVFWLGQLHREESLDLLLDLLSRSTNISLREKIVFAISQHDSRRAATVLIRVARKEENPEVRKKAIFWLGQMAGRKTLQALGDIVESDDETEVRTKAVFAISQHEDKELAFNMLKEIAQNNPSPKVRKKAMFWMGQMGDARAVDFFKDILIKNN